MGGRKGRTSMFDLAMYNRRKIVKDGPRAAGKGSRKGEEDNESVDSDDATDYTPRHGRAWKSSLQRAQRQSVAYLNGH
jgi:hypothetical protein